MDPLRRLRQIALLIAGRGDRVLRPLAAARLTIIGDVGAVIVEAISGRVLMGALAERQRTKSIHQPRNHVIICGSRRVGRRVAEECRAGGTRHVVADCRSDAVDGLCASGEQAARTIPDLWMRRHTGETGAVEPRRLEEMFALAR